MKYRGILTIIDKKVDQALAQIFGEEQPEEVQIEPQATLPPESDAQYEELLEELEEILEQLRELKLD